MVPEFWKNFEEFLSNILDKEKPPYLPWKKYKEGDMTWEDYDEFIKKKKPILFFLLETVPSFIGFYILSPIDDFFYFIKSHLIQNYKLDLRQPKDSCENYRYGFLTADKKILYACFNSFIEYVEDRQKCEYFYGMHNVEELEKESPEMTEQIAAYKEMKEIYNYWKKDRAVLEQEYNDSINDWYKNRNSLGSKEKLDKTTELEKRNIEKETEYLVRLIKIKDWLW